jgi:transposase-like protein
MTKQFSVAFKQKMVQRLTGRNAVSALQLARETGVRQQNLSRWLEEARSVSIMAHTPKPAVPEWTVEQKARVLAEAAQLDGEKLTVYLEHERVKLADYEQWRIALEEGGRASASTNKRIRQLERELARKEKALAEAAALLVLKKKWRHSTGRTRTATRTARTRSDPRTHLGSEASSAGVLTPRSAIVAADCIVGQATRCRQPRRHRS